MKVSEIAFDALFEVILTVLLLRIGFIYQKL